MNQLNISETDEECDESVSKDMLRKGENSLKKCATSDYTKKKKLSSRASYLQTMDVTSQIR